MSATHNTVYFVMPDPIRHPVPVAQVLTQSEDWLVMPDPIRHPVLASTGLRIKSAMTTGDAMTNANKRYFGNFYLPKQSLTHQSQRSY
jgi:hypothetical protein